MLEQQGFKTKPVVLGILAAVIGLAALNVMSIMITAILGCLAPWTPKGSRILAGGKAVPAQPPEQSPNI